MPSAVPSASPRGTGKAGLPVLPGAGSSPSLSTSGNRPPRCSDTKLGIILVPPCPVSHQVCPHPVHAALCPGAGLEGPHQWAPSESGSEPAGSGQEITGEGREVERSVNSLPGSLSTGESQSTAWLDPPLRVAIPLKQPSPSGSSGSPSS